MKKKLEPLLKEEVETFPFLEEKKERGKIKVDRVFITTIILSAIVVLFVGNSLYAFYIGFKHYDLRNEPIEENQNEIKGEEVPLSSAILNDTYQKINATNNNILSDTLKTIYSGNIVEAKNLSTKDKLNIIISNLGMNCNKTQVSVSKDELKNMAINLFNDDSIINSLENSSEIDSFTISYDENTNNYTISKGNCDTTNDFVVKAISKAISNEDELYIYEKFGYFASEQGKKYNAYGNALASGNIITIFTDEEGKKSFNNPEILKTYKWTYKKSNNNNYYLVSITPE